MRLVSVLFAFLFLAAVVAAQAPARGGTPARGAGQAAGRGGAQPQVLGNLAQVMRAISFPNSNIIFDVQDNDPAKKKPDPNGPYIGQYQGWEGVENAGIALYEVANLILLPGRKCENGRAVPIQAADFQKYAAALRATGLAVYNAAKTKKQDAVANLSDKLTETCANCHDKYRPDSRIEPGAPKVGKEARCMP